MRYLIITSLSASIFTAITTQNELFSILFSVAGVFLLYWFVFHTSTMKKEIAFLRKSILYRFFPEYPYSGHITSHSAEVSLQQ